MVLCLGALWAGGEALGPAVREAHDERWYTYIFIYVIILVDSVKLNHDIVRMFSIEPVKKTNVPSGLY